MLFTLFILATISCNILNITAGMIFTGIIAFPALILVALCMPFILIMVNIFLYLIGLVSLITFGIGSVAALIYGPFVLMGIHTGVTAMLVGDWVVSNCDKILSLEGILNDHLL